MDSNTLTAALTGLPVPALRWLDATGSTNADAQQWAEEGAPDGALVAADSQTAGRGRLRRGWVTRAGAALAFSLVLRPTAAETIHLALLSPLAALAVCLALEETLHLRPQIKWPNDVLLDGKKTAGILAETSWLGSLPEAVVIGVGINVAPSSVPPAKTLRYPATCVEQAAGQTVDRAALLRQTLADFFVWRPRLGSPDFLRAWQQRLAFLNQPVRILQQNRPDVEGLLLGVDVEGCLRLQCEPGKEVTLTAGDVSLRPSAGGTAR